MIPADKWRLFDAWFVRHAHTRLTHAFHALYVHGLRETAAVAKDAPLLFVSNHTSFHDPLVALVLARALRLDAYAMMDAKNLERLPFFKRVGAFGVDLASPRDGARALRYGAGLLDRPGRAVWIFPQGKTCAITEPLVFRGGSARIARLAPSARIVPMAVRYELADAERPIAWVSLGHPLEPHAGRAAEVTQAHVSAVAAELARIEASVHARAPAESFERLFETKPSWLGTFAERALSWMFG